MCTTTISRSFLKEFIELFRQQEALWNIKSESYKNRFEKQKSWDKLINKYKEIEADATLDTVKRKINALRTSYRRELQKKRQSERSASSPDDIYQPALWYFDALTFLGYQVKPFIFASLDDPLEIEKPCPSKKRQFTETEAVQHLDESKKQKDRDESDVFAEGWGMIYRKLDDVQKLFAKRVIDETLMQGQLGRLTYASTLVVGEQNITYASQRVKTSPPASPADSSMSSLALLSASEFESSHMVNNPSKVEILSKNQISQPSPLQQFFDKKYFD